MCLKLIYQFKNPINKKEELLYFYLNSTLVECLTKQFTELEIIERKNV